jgi:CRP/FNR family transcriptional regulator, cyclic AMP receptor protein
MKTIYCALHQRKQKRKRKPGVETVGFTRSVPRRRRESQLRPFSLLDRFEDALVTLTQAEPLATRVALHPFLAGMSRTHLALLTDCAIAAHFDKGQTILRKGEFAKGFYLIESGELVLESGEESGEPVVVDTIGPGNSLGWSWMFPPYVWRFTACAVEPIDAIFLYGTTLREYCEKDHSLGYELLKRTTLVMLRRLQATRDRMLSILQELDTYKNEGKR